MFGLTSSSSSSGRLSFIIIIPPKLFFLTGSYRESSLKEICLSCAGTTLDRFSRIWKFSSFFFVLFFLWSLVLVLFSCVSSSTSIWSPFSCCSDFLAGLLLLLSSTERLWRPKSLKSIWNSPGVQTSLPFLQLPPVSAVTWLGKHTRRVSRWK